MEYVEEDGLVELEVEIGAGHLLETRGDDVSYWGLDRINQKTLPLDGNVSFVGRNYFRLEKKDKLAKVGLEPTIFGLMYRCSGGPPI